MAATSAYIRDLLKRNPVQHPTIIMPTNIRSTDLQYIMDFIYQGKVTVPASELENFMSAGAILQIRGLKSKSEMPSSNSAGPQIVTKQSDITTTAPGLRPAQQNIVKTQAEKPKGSTGKSLSEALIFASSSQYDDRLLIELQVQYMKIPS